jgi:two-component system cell cycle sensor histidine kinase PleC
MTAPAHDQLTISALSDPRAAFVLARQSFRAEIAPKTEAEAKLTLQKIRMAAANLKPGMAIMPILSILIALVHMRWFEWWYPALWAAITIAAWIPGWRFVVRLLSAPDDSLDPRQTTRAVLWRTSLFVFCYGSLGLWFWVPHEPLNHMTVTIILLGSSIAGAMTAAWLPLSLLQIAVYVGSAVFLFLQRGEGGVYYEIAGLALFYAVFVSGVVISLHAYSVRLLNLESHKDDLIADLRRSNQVKSDFLANMSHELRTPMNAILGFSEVIKDEVMGPSNKPIYRDYAADIHASGSHLLGLINDILDLSKIEAGKFELREQEFDLHDIAQIAVRMIALRIEQKRIRLSVAIPQGLTVWGDPHAFKQIALNIASNALKFTPEGGTIDCWLTRDDGFLTIHVRDSGCGIRQDDLERVFESFGQGRHDVAQADKSTGLGLPIVRGLMRAHGGDATLISEVGKGTEVRLTMPLSRVRSWPATVTEAA